MTEMKETASSGSDDNDKCKDAKKEKSEKCGTIPQLKKGSKVIMNYKNAKMVKDVTRQQIDARLKGIDDCLAGRKRVTDECFEGVTDQRHHDEEENLRKAKCKTLDLKKHLEKNVW